MRLLRAVCGGRGTRGGLIIGCADAIIAGAKKEEAI